MTENEFEQSFQKAIKIRFIKTDNYDIEPPVIAIIFSNDKDGIESYKFMQNKLTRDEINIVFFA